ncbi:hypothetical protein K501DRAFT_204214 [Backusella circina FSU 941]|nr:hypothetical protein K501DRAFT_204214 [Backusella circina FSU 941]
MKSIFAAIAALAITAVSAQGATASISSPLTGTVYTAGSDATIAWYNPVVATISQINLLKGPASALVPVASVATNVDASLGQYVWTIPAGTAAGNDYAFGLGSNPNVSYTGFFTINAGTGGKFLIGLIRN